MTIFDDQRRKILKLVDRNEVKVKKGGFVKKSLSERMMGFSF